MRSPVAHSVNDHARDTAWFSDQPPRHPACVVSCPTCGAAGDTPCIATIGTVAPIRGLHAERLRAAEGE